jgi:hypothetical protein
MTDNRKVKEQEVAWLVATEHYAISAREYFYILRLALYHVLGVATDSSYETAQAMETATPEVYECAIDILSIMYKEK